MSDELRPALTADEWVRVASREPTMSRISLIDDLDMLDPEELAAAMAYTNHLLPDHSPQKITRDDVEVLREAFEHYRDIQAPGYRAFARLAAKLAAILPPDPA